eukprot:5467931-Lingulodinium_polyedra.AAC.1
MGIPKTAAANQEGMVRTRTCTLLGPALILLLRAVPQMDGELKRRVWVMWPAMGMARPLTTIDWLLVVVVMTRPLPLSSPRTPSSRPHLLPLLRH